MPTSWHLAIESSGLGGSVALFQYGTGQQGACQKGTVQEGLGPQGELHSQQVLPCQQGSVRNLAPAIDSLLRDAQVLPRQLSSLSVTCGPGSFTGLRVGLATAKMLAWTLNIPVVPVDTLEAIASRFAQSNSIAQLNSVELNSVEPGKLPSRYRLVTAMNAFRKQVFTSSWIVANSTQNADSPRLECAHRSTVVDADKWLADPWQVAASDRSCDDAPLWISGGAIGTYAGLDTMRCNLADASLWQPLAEQVGRLGLKGLATGRAVTAHELVPNYIRSSAAEENVGRR